MTLPLFRDVTNRVWKALFPPESDTSTDQVVHLHHCSVAWRTDEDVLLEAA